MVLNTILIFIKNNYIFGLLGLFLSIYSYIIYYLYVKEKFGVNKFCSQFSKLYKSIRKKARKGKDIPYLEVKDVSLQIETLSNMYKKVIVSVNNAQNLSVKEQEFYLSQLDKSHLKFIKFSKYISTYQNQIKDMENFENYPLRVADELPSYEDIWK